MTDYKEFAVKTSKEAGRILIKNYGRMQDLEWHLKTNFKIKVDNLSDELIRQRIMENFPEHNVYTEEGVGMSRNSEYSWVIDPLDGTIPYTFGINDHFSVCIALVREKTPVLGVIYAPKRDELYVAEQGNGAFCNDSPISVSLEDNINRILVNMDCGKVAKGYSRDEISSYHKKLLADNGVTYVVSSACASLPLCFTASGKLQAYIGLGLEPWDMAAAVIINREAGGKVTTVEGKEWELGDDSIFVANPRLHKNLNYFLNN